MGIEVRYMKFLEEITVCPIVQFFSGRRLHFSLITFFLYASLPVYVSFPKSLDSGLFLT